MAFSSSTSIGGTYEIACEPDRTPVSRIEDTLTEALGLADRVRALADTLVGAAPEACGKNDPPLPAALGLFHVLDDRARTVASQINAAHAALNRIDAVTR